MKYTALLKGIAHQLGYEIVWSPPQLVNGSINPPPSLRYPGLTCYMAQVRVGPREFSGFGPTAVSATHIAESKAYVELYFHLREKRTNSRGYCYQSSSSVGDGARETSTRERREVGEASDEERRVLKRFARECNEYFKSVKRDGPTGTPVGSTRDGVLPSEQRGVVCSGAHSWKRAGVGHRGGHGIVAGLDSSEESCSVFSSSEEGEEEEEKDEEEGEEEVEEGKGEGKGKEEEGDVTALVCAFQCLKLTGGGPKTEFVDSPHPKLDRSSSDTSVPFANAIEQNSDGADTKSEVSNTVSDPFTDVIAQNSGVSNTLPVQNIDGSTISVQNSDSESGTVTLNTVPNVSDNPIGQLQELFMQESGPLPTYQFSADGAKDKNRPTVFHCVVHIYGFQGKGIRICLSV